MLISVAAGDCDFLDPCVIEQEVEAGLDKSLTFDRLVDGLRNLIGLRRVHVEVAVDQVTAQEQHQLVDLDVLAFLADHPHDPLKEGRNADLGNRHIELVVTVDLFGLDPRTEVPVGSHRHCRRLRLSRLLSCKNRV